MRAKARGAARAALTGIDVEEFTGNDDDFLLEYAFEKAHAVCELTRQLAQVAPDLKRAAGFSVGLNTQLPETVEEEATLCSESPVDRGSFTTDRIGGK